MHKTSAWPLALVYAGLIVYASLYPFSDWRDQGITPWAYLWQPLPKYWTGFDIGINVVGYGPFGFLLALSVLRTGRSSHAVLAATLTGVLVSLALETLQSYLPTRVPSNVDWALNGVGTLLGAAVAAWLERAGALARWARVRERWFVGNARGGLVLLALWPIAVFFPSVVPLGLGQVMERLESALAETLQDTPFLDWLPVRDVELQPMVPSTELICVLLGALIPCLLGFCILRSVGRRTVFVLGVIAASVGVTALSWALSFGPAHAWGWLSLQVELGLAAALVLGLIFSPMPMRANAGLALLCIGIYLSLINQAPASPYFAQTLALWEQGQFIRFHGVVQWLGWLWPYAALAYAWSLLLVRDSKN